MLPQFPILGKHEMAPEVKLQFMQIAQLAQRIQCRAAEARRLGGAFAKVASCALVGYTGQFLGMPLLTPINGVQACGEPKAPPRPWFPDHHEAGATDASTELELMVTPAAASP